ncbi:hypothetical protein BGHDH14_bgh00165 [Blumeria hordei DH14]|uniref:t-SNARE coiled-coil homology domain-containing protein n=1 Tax=Blumeria graminis f. sp. hordei (strain DH14) TaxID=546991 RepID=N1JIS5_BLUG1|nr:hypothetical protein BGHDH14_bgh00165 [Blumeria hordei DH14]
MWRDRTNLYISYRQSYAYHPSKKLKTTRPNNGFDTLSSPSERQGLISASAFEDDGDALIEMDLLPPRWADISEDIDEYLAGISTKSQKLEILHQKHVLPGFDDEEVKRNEEVQIERITQEITKGFHDCQKAIQRVDLLVREGKAQGGLSRGEEVMAKNIQISLAGKVQEASANFRKKQSAYLKKLRGMSGATVPISDKSTIPLNTLTDRSAQESDADKFYSQSALQQTTISNNTAINQREREISDIAQGIIELADIFKELQTMIIDQGTMLDRIDYNVEQMAVDVKAADKEVKTASSYQKKGTRRRIILLLILMVVGMFILLTVKRKSHG